MFAGGLATMDLLAAKDQHVCYAVCPTSFCIEHHETKIDFPSLIHKIKVNFFLQMFCYHLFFQRVHESICSLIMIAFPLEQYETPNSTSLFHHHYNQFKIQFPFISFLILFNTSFIFHITWTVVLTVIFLYMLLYMDFNKKIIQYTVFGQYHKC